MQLLAILRKTVINVCACTYKELLSAAKKPSINYNKELTTKYTNPLIRKLTNCSLHSCHFSDLSQFQF